MQVMLCFECSRLTTLGFRIQCSLEFKVPNSLQLPENKRVFNESFSYSTKHVTQNFSLVTLFSPHYVHIANMLKVLGVRS